MSKRPLKLPQLPPTSGAARREFFMRAQHLVLEAGDPAVATIAADIGLSHQTVYQALTGPRMPSRRVVDLLAERLGGAADDDLLVLWQRGVAEERAPRKNTPLLPWTSTPPPFVEHDVSRDVNIDRRPAGKAVDRARRGQETLRARRESKILRELYPWKAVVERTPPPLSDREQEAVSAWLRSSSKEEAARELGVAAPTLATYLARVRAKYASVGRPAPSKSAMRERALEDGVVDASDLRP